jgi:hypothetical protein
MKNLKEKLQKDPTPFQIFWAFMSLLGIFILTCWLIYLAI